MPADSNRILITVVIPTLGRQEYLLDTLHDLAKQEFPNWECLIVTQAYMDLAPIHLLADETRSAVRIFRCNEPNASLARNIGLIEARGEVVLFLDDDLEIRNPCFLSHHWQNYADPNASGVCGQVLAPGFSPDSASQMEPPPWNRMALFSVKLRLPLRRSKRCVLQPVYPARMGNCDRGDVIHCHYGPNGQRAVSLRKAGMFCGPVITTFHGYDANLLPGIHGTGLYEMLFKKGDVFTVGSEFMRQRIISLGAPKARIVKLPMGVDLSRFRFAGRQKAANDEFRLLTVARLAEVKGIEYALRAVAILKDKYPRLRYQIAGDGPLKDKLEALKMALGLEPTVEFVGAVSQEECLCLYESAHAFILPSVVTESGEEENQPVVLAEAQACGLPVIATSIGGIPESMQGGIMMDICTPPKTHAKIAIQAMQAGSNVLIEKPMAQSVEECDSIIAGARENKVKVCVAHSDLFYYPFIEARKLVRDGGIGPFRGMRIFLSTPTDYITSKPDHWANKLPGGVIGETGPHIIYMTLAFINPIRDVSVNAVKLMGYPWSPFEDYRIDLVGERSVSSVTLSYATKQWMARVEILGEDATLLVDLEAMSLVKYRRERLRPVPIGMSLLSETGQLFKCLAVSGLRYATGSLRSTHDFIIGGFAHSIINGTESPVPAEEGRESVRVLKMIVEKLNSRERSGQ